MDAIYLIPKISYEILNTPIEELADGLGMSTNMLQSVINNRGWVRQFPDDEVLDADSQETQEILEGEDIFTVQADQFLDKSRKRLQLFNMAKSLALAERYAKLESAIIDKATRAVEAVEVSEVPSIAALANAFKALAKDLNGAANAISFAQDQQGLPTVIMRDLSGTT